MEHQILGLTLEQAVVLLREQGIEPVVSVAAAPNDKRAESGVLRVVRVQGEHLTVNRFTDNVCT